MIVSTLMAAAVAVQPAPRSQPDPAPAPAAEKKMACCDKMRNGKGCCCCGGLAKETAPAVDHSEHGAAITN